MDSPEVNKAFAEVLEVDFPLLSDSTRKVALAYGVISQAQPFATRATFYIGPDGRILDVDAKVTPETHGATLAARLAELGVPRRARDTNAP